MTKLQNLLKGLIKENPVLVLVLGTCPTLAISTSVTAAFGMGIAATVVLILSNMAISALRKVIPDTVRIPCYITVIAGFVTIVELVMEAYTYELYQSLGVYLALIVVNCIINHHIPDIAHTADRWTKTRHKRFHTPYSSHRPAVRSPSPYAFPAPVYFLRRPACLRKW